MGDDYREKGVTFMNGYFLLGLGLVGFGVLLIVSGILKKGRCSCNTNFQLKQDDIQERAVIL